MARTVVDVDEDALVKAQAALGTTSKVDTINEALRRVVADEERRQALLREMVRGDQYAELADPQAPWR